MKANAGAKTPHDPGPDRGLPGACPGKECRKGHTRLGRPCKNEDQGRKALLLQPCRGVVRPKRVMNRNHVVRLHVQGFKSFQSCTMDLSGTLNVLIGAHGSGKSCFLQAFAFLRHLASGRLDEYTARHGGAEALLFGGRATTRTMHMEATFADGRSFQCSLEPTGDNRLRLAAAHVCLPEGTPLAAQPEHSRSEHLKHLTDTPCDGRPWPAHIRDLQDAMTTWRVVHLGTTGDAAPVRQRQAVTDACFLRSDARNLAPLLYALKDSHPVHSARIVATVRLTVPFFQDFSLQPCKDRPDQIELCWLEKGRREPLKAQLLSDSTLRILCLTTLLQLPDALRPATIFLDEPDSGLHPASHAIACALMHSASHSGQLIVASHSPALVDTCTPDNLIVFDRSSQGTRVHRLEGTALAPWLKEDSLGTLWQMNLLGGRP